MKVFGRRTGWKSAAQNFQECRLIDHFDVIERSRCVGVDGLCQLEVWRMVSCRRRRGGRIREIWFLFCSGEQSRLCDRETRTRLRRPVAGKKSGAYSRLANHCPGRDVLGVGLHNMSNATIQTLLCTGRRRSKMVKRTRISERTDAILFLGVLHYLSFRLF